jgi:hypothetical protein
VNGADGLLSLAGRTITNRASAEWMATPLFNAHKGYFATLAPPGVLLSEEINQDRRAECERERCPRCFRRDGVSLFRTRLRCCMGRALRRGHVGLQLLGGAEEGN